MVFFLEIYEIVQSTLGQVDTQKKGTEKKCTTAHNIHKYESALFKIPFYRA